MATIDGLTQRILSPDDIDGAMILVKEAGWNQVPADWQLMCHAGEAVVMRDKSSEIVASALALPYPGGFGWISMVLVTANMRRNGLATLLLRDRVAWLQERGLVPILDATEAGEQIYTKSGFITRARLTRWQGQGPKTSAASGAIRNANANDRSWIQLLDADVFGADRSNLIHDFLNRQGSKCFVIEGAENGFIISRQGRCATQFGPLVSASERDAVALVDAALAMTEGPVFFDLLDTRKELAAHISSLGFEKQRGFARMSLGECPDFNGDGRAMVVAGPEYG